MSEQINIDELERLAKDATKSPWKASFTQISNVETMDGALIARCNKLNSLTQLQANAHYIAAANPATVLSLIDHLRKAEAERDALADKLKELEGQEPVFWYRPVCDGEMYEGPVHNNSAGGKMRRDEKPGEWKPLFARPVPAELSKWEGAEEWMPLAYHLCAEECGEDACHELIWEGGPIPEPWGDRWMKYEDVAKDMIATVRKFVPAEPVANSGNEKAESRSNAGLEAGQSVNARLVEALRKAEKKLVELEHSVGGGDGEIVMESEILSARAAIAAAESQQAEPVRLTDEEIARAVPGAEVVDQVTRGVIMLTARSIEAAVLRANGYKVEG